MALKPVNNTEYYNKNEGLQEQLYPPRRSLSGFFVGQVVSDLDEQNRGRVKVRVQSIHASDEREDLLPYALPLSLDGHSLLAPEIGDFVAVIFLNNQIDTPAVVGIFPNENAFENTNPNDNQDLFYKNKDSEGDIEFRRDKEVITESIEKGSDSNVITKDPSSDTQSITDGSSNSNIESRDASSFNREIKDVAQNTASQSQTPSQTELAVQSAAGGESLSMSVSGTEITNSLTSPIAQPVVLEDKLKTFWSIIFKIFMDTNWTLITSHVHVGQIGNLGIPVIPAPGIPTPIPSTPTINNVKSDNLKAGTIVPIGS